MVFAVADQVGAPHGLERLAQQRPVVRVVVAQKGFVQTAALLAAHDVHALLITLHGTAHFAQRVASAVVHRRGGGHGAGVEGLDLVGPKTVFLEPDGQVHHVLVAGARMGGDEIRNQKLFFAHLGAVLVKQRLEFVVAADTGLHHLGQRPLLGVLGRDLEVAAHMVLHQFFDVLRAFDGQVVAQARTNQDFFDALERAAAPVHLDQGAVVGRQVLANAGVDAARFAAGRLDLGRSAAQAVHIGRGAAQVGNRAGKAFDFVADVLDFLNHRVL